MTGQFMKNLFFAALGAMVLLAAGGAAASEGRLVFVDGAVRIVRANQAPIEARIGDTVPSGARIVTGAGRAHLKFPDGALLSLQPNTTFVMDQYVFSGSNDGNEQFVGNLIKGGLRMVTGLIGRRDSRVFRIEGVVATVGIRGTAFKMEFCNKDCGARADGLYVDGGEGTTTVTNAGGTLALTRGGSAFVANRQTAPERTSQRTSVAAPPPPRAPAQLVGAVREEQKFADYSFKTGNLQGPFRSVNVTQAGGAFAAFGDNGTASIGGGSGVAGSDGTVYVVLDAGNRLFAIGGSASDASLFLTTDNVVNAGTDGLLYWGRWANGKVQANYTDAFTGKSGAGTVDLSGAKGAYYIVSQQVSTIPSSGTASYSFYASAGSVSADGVTGAGVTAGSLNVNFLSNSGNLSMTVAHGGSNLTQSGAFSLNSANRAAFSGSGTGSYPFSFEGFLGGGNRADGKPERAGVGYVIERPGNAITGVAGFK
jgi:hypothetical protein